MGRKHKHSKDKLYKTVSELTSRHVGEDRDLELSTLHRRLKFDSCCLSLNTIEKKPMGLCDHSGYCYLFECDLIVKFLEKFNQIHPITGERVTARDLFELKFHKNNEGLYHCPVTLKLFNQYSKIVANRKSGHVYSYQAYHDMNAKPKWYRDLLTDEPFDKSDIVIIQDPDQAAVKWNVSDFYYVKNKLKLHDDSSDSKIRNIDNQSSILKSSLEEYRRRADEIVETFHKIVGKGQAPTSSNNDEKLDKINSAIYSDGRLSSSVTSTVMPVTQTQKAALLSEEQIIYPKIKKKAHVQLLTNFGPINLELFCDRAPKTCHNFLLLVSRKYYDNTIFHRLIKNFILQGGDPTGTGSGGQSAWGEPFHDEFRGDLKHEGRGVLAMANSGPNTNKSQFYITLRGSWDHLDRKHTVFGRVVGGIATLEKIETEVETDKNDRPKKEIKIIRATKFSDPFEEVQAAIAAERKLLAAAADPSVSQATKRPHSSVDGNADSFRKKVSLSVTDSDMEHSDSHRSSSCRSGDANGGGAPSTAAMASRADGSSARAQPGSSNTSTSTRTNGKKSSSFGNFDNW
jgi:peptidyl-prolyl cis-trans isomerase-like protein 2